MPSGSVMAAMFSTTPDDALAGLARDEAAAHGDVGCRGLRGRHHEDLGVGEQLPDRDRDVARAGRHVEQEDVEVAEEDVGEELLHGAVQHRPAPGDGAERRFAAVRRRNMPIEMTFTP